MPLVHLQELEGTSAPVTLHLRGFHKWILQMARQPQVLSTGPTLGVTSSGVKPSTLKGRAYQLQGPGGEKGSKQAGITDRQAP